MWLPIIPFYSIRTNRNVAYHTVFLHFYISRKADSNPRWVHGDSILKVWYCPLQIRGTSKHYRKEWVLAFSLNDRYKKSDECFKIIGKTLDSICIKLDVQANVDVKQPPMPKTLKEVPSFLLCTIPWYWIRHIWYSRHVKQFALILMLCSWALSIGLTLFLARENCYLQTHYYIPQSE